jgi:glycosyltransferase involved in cell wall biosynthesis
MKDQVLIIGYLPKISGGVTTVMGLLLERIPFLELHVALYCHRPRWKSIVLSAIAFCKFLWRLFVAAPKVVQPIIGSRGDAVRMLPYIWAAKLRGCKVCLHFHKNMAAIFDDMPSWVRRMILASWHSSDGYLFLSEKLRDEFCRWLDSPKPHFVIPNPISEKWFREQVLPYDRRPISLVFFGRWSPEKGKDDLIAAMASFDGENSPQCHIYSDHRPLENPRNCICHDWIAEDEVRRVLRQSKLLLLPSHAEAFPTVLLEAAACGTPFVATNIAGIPDIAEASQAGLLHEVGDIRGMCEAVSRLLTDEKLWSDFSRHGRRWVESLEVSKVAPRWRRLYAAMGVNSQDSHSTELACEKSETFA